MVGEWDRARDGDNSPEAVPSGKGKGKGKEDGPAVKRRCVSSACIACRRRKSKVSRKVSPDRQLRPSY